MQRVKVPLPLLSYGLLKGSHRNAFLAQPRNPKNIYIANLYIRSVSSDQAPIIAQHTQPYTNTIINDQYMTESVSGTLVTPYRLFDGKIWSPFRHTDMSPVTPFDMVHDIRRGDGGHSAGSKTWRWLQKGVIQAPPIGRLLLRDYKYCDDSGIGDPEVQHILPDLDENFQDRVLLVDNELWYVSSGPKIGIRYGFEFQNMAKWFHQDEWSSHLSRSHLTFSALDMDGTKKLLQEFYGEVEILWADIEIFDNVIPAPDEILHESAERGLWNFLWWTSYADFARNRPLVDIQYRIRKALEERWPTIDLSFNLRKLSSSNNYAAVSHLYGRESPSSEPLLPLLQDAADFFKQHATNPNVSRHLEMTAKRVEEWVAKKNAPELDNVFL